MILVDGLYINKGGGAVLLQYLIEQVCLYPCRNKFFFLLDPRFDIPKQLPADSYTVIPNKMSDRSRFYKTTGARYSKVFCFANTPPPVRLKVPVYTYSHNQKLLEAPYRKFERSFWKLYAKYLVIKLFNRNTDYYMVQTQHMVDEMLDLKLKDAAHILTYPFYNAERYQVPTPPFAERPADQFAFISTPSPQKNYPTLLDAWEYLHEQGHTPGLHITIDNTAPHLLARLDAMKAKGIQVFNYSYIDPRELYFKYRYLVCPSIMESFGLPLIESVESGMKVLAPDMPYVHDVIKPSLVFDPLDKVSIANAVIRALSEDIPAPAVKAENKVLELIALLDA